MEALRVSESKEFGELDEMRRRFRFVLYLSSNQMATTMHANTITPRLVPSYAVNTAVSKLGRIFFIFTIYYFIM